MPRIETVKIKSDAHPSGYITVNKDQAEKYEQKPAKATASKKPASKSAD